MSERETPPEAPKPETDFETMARKAVDDAWYALQYGRTHAKAHFVLTFAATLEAAHTTLSARLAEVERERDERTDCLAREIEALRADVITAETALATAQGQLAAADAVIAWWDGCGYVAHSWPQIAGLKNDALARHAARAAGKGTDAKAANTDEAR